MSKVSSAANSALESKVNKLEETTSNLLTAFNTISKQNESMTFMMTQLLAGNTEPNVIIRQAKGGRADSVVDGAGPSGIASTSSDLPSSVPSVPPTDPPTSSVPSASASGKPSSGTSPMPSDASLGAGRGVKREGDTVLKAPKAKGRKVASVVEFREGKEYAVQGDVDSGNFKGSILQGLVQEGANASGASLGYQGGHSSDFQIDEGIGDNGDKDVHDREDREDGELSEEEDRAAPSFEVPGYALDHSAAKGSDWGLWGMLKPPHSLLYLNGEKKGLYNSATGQQTPIEDVKLATLEDGSMMFSVRHKRPIFKVRKSAEVFGTAGDKSRASQFFGMFQSLFTKGTEDMTKEWMKNFDSTVLVPSGVLSDADFPFSLDHAIKVFRDTASGIKTTNPTLAPTVIPYTSKYEDIVACLPMPKFSASLLASEFGVSSTAVVSLNKDLIQEEFNRRMCLLTVLSLFSSRLALYTLPGEIKTLSAFEASVRNNVGGYSGMVNYLANMMLKDFANARVALRKSVFRNPDDHFPMRMILASPFSKTLFCMAEKEAIAVDFGRFNKTLSWEKLFKPSSASSSKTPAPKAGPSQPKPNVHHNNSFNAPARGRGKGGPFKSSRGRGNQGQKFRYNQGNQNQRPSRGRGGKQN